MKLATKPEEIFAAQQKVKQNGKSVVTNFYADTEKLDDWLANKSLRFIETANGVLFLRRNDFFSHLYYYAASFDDLVILINEHLPEDERLAVDIIGKPANIEGMIKLFVNANFRKYTQLDRYTRINTPDKQFYQSSEEVALAAPEDAETIAAMFAANFDRLSEQVPNLTEVRELIAAAKILVVKKGYLKGFLVRTFTGQATILNNFLVDKRSRGEKIGSKLLKHYIFEARDTKRMTLWVIFDNHIAINAYEQHGYAKDDFVDVILTNR